MTNSPHRRLARMVEHNEAIQFLNNADKLLHAVRACEAKRASAKTTAEMSAETRAEKTQTRVKIDKTLDELKESIENMRKVLANELRDEGAKATKKNQAITAASINKQVITDAFNSTNAEYELACELAYTATGDFEYELRTRQCVARARGLLKEPKIPRYIRTRTLLLLVKMVPDYDKALDFHRKADRLLRIARERQVKGANADDDDAWDEVEESVERLRGLLAEEVAAARADDTESDDSAYHTDSDD
jgi:hypothetical protein